jgi:formylglycine-generating enzyme required for sulfatase activity
MSEIFLSYSRNDNTEASSLKAALERAGLQVFKDDASLRSGDRWLGRLQTAVGRCDAFVVQVGRDGVQRWIGAEVEVALIRHHQPHDEAERLPIFPILLPDAVPESLPPFLALFQATRWDGVSALPAPLIEALRARHALQATRPTFQGNPFRGLGAFTQEHTQQFFGRRSETLAALALLGDATESDPTQLAGYGRSQYVRWLQVTGNSGAGKSSLVQAGLLPMIRSGALWARTGVEQWTLIGPMVPGQEPVEMLAEVLERGLIDAPGQRDIGKRRAQLERGERELAYALRAYGSDQRRAFLLVIDQFEELFTFADEAGRNTFEALLAHALQDPECPFFLITTVRADFLDRFDQLPKLGGPYNTTCRQYFLPSISEQGLREVIDGPATLAGLDVSEVRTAILEDAREEMAGALPLVENALSVLWEKREGPEGKRLSGEKYRSLGKLAGILASQADSLLARIDAEIKLKAGVAGRGRQGALELLLRLTCVNDDGRNTRQRISRHDAILTAGAGRDDIGEHIVRRLSGHPDESAPVMARHGLRLIVVTAEQSADSKPVKDEDGRLLGHVDLIHETLIRARGKDDKGKPVGYWPTLFDYIAVHPDRGDQLRRLKKQALDWSKSRWLGRWWHLAGWADRSAYAPLSVHKGSVEARFLRWSQWAGRVHVGLAALGIAFSVHVLALKSWADKNNYPSAFIWLDLKWSLGIDTPPQPKLVDIVTDRPVTFAMGCDPKRDADKVLDGEKGDSSLLRLTCDKSNAFHDVTLTKPYSLGKFELSRREYLFFLRDSGEKGSQRVECRGVPAPEYPPITSPANLDLPAIKVSWCDANAYLEWLNARYPDSEKRWRLPTEAEWEHAARGDTRTAYWWGASYEGGYVNCVGEKGPWLVTQRGEKQNRKPPFGLNNMLGNVWEWVEDAYSPFGSTSQTDPVGRGNKDQPSRVLRGGAGNYYPVDCRAALRNYYTPDLRYDFLGFRVCRGSPIETRDAATLGAEAPSR